MTCFNRIAMNLRLRRVVCWFLVLTTLLVLATLSFWDSVVFGARNIKGSKAHCCTNKTINCRQILQQFTSEVSGNFSMDKENRAHLTECFFPGDISQKTQDVPLSKRELESCPRDPPGLVGKLDVNPRTALSNLLNYEVLKRVGPGGTYKPSDCSPLENVALIIPYRDRQTQLNIFLMHIHTVLQRQMLAYTIYVVEMALPSLFNRGILANAGFWTAESSPRHTCFIFHDVDLLPANDKNMYTCSSAPRHLSTANSKFNYTLPYDSYFGGVSVFTKKQFRTINGFPNRFFGWGAEDDDLYHRTVAAGYVIQRPSHDVGVYEALHHGKDPGNPNNPYRLNLLRDRRKAAYDGLSNSKFTRLALEFRPLYTWVFIEVNERKVMEPFRKSMQGQH